MSGGSWDYLSGQQELPRREDMFRAAERLRALGDAASADEVFAIALQISVAKTAWDNAMSAREALHDMEWVDSGDTLESDFHEERAKRDAKRAERMKITAADVTLPKR